MEKKRISMFGKPAYYIFLDPSDKWRIPEVLAAFGFKPIGIEQSSDTCGIPICYSANGIALHAVIDPDKRPYLVVFDHAPRDLESYTTLDFVAYAKAYEKCNSGIMDYWPDFLRPATNYSFYSKLNIKKIIVNDPAVIVFFEDREKIVLKRREGDQFDLDDAISIALCQKMFGKAGYRKRLKKAKKNIYIQYLGPVERMPKTIKEIGDLDHAD